MTGCVCVRMCMGLGHYSLTKKGPEIYILWKLTGRGGGFIIFFRESVFHRKKLYFFYSIMTSRTLFYEGYFTT